MTLTRAWLLLVGLTLLSLIAVLGLGRSETGLVAAAIALAAAFFKARLVLDHFLGLRRAGGQWGSFFTALLLVILGGLMAAYAAIPMFTPS